MYQNFIFDGQSNERYGVICVSFEPKSGLNTVSACGKTDLKLEKSARGNEFYITGQEYTSTMSYTFQIMNIDQTPISTVQQREIQKWLCKRGVFKNFQIDNDEYYDVRYEVNISDPKLINVSNTVGMEFTVTTKAPYGLSPIAMKNYTITNESKSIRVYIDNDEDDYVYPKLEITMLEAGNFTISNSSEVEHRTFEIDNLNVGEVISVDNKLPYVTSSTTHEPFADCNKHWIRLADGLNTLTFNLNCTIKMEFQQIRKVGLFA